RHLPREGDAAARELGRRNLGGRARRPRNDVGQGKPPRGKPDIVFVRARLGHEPGGVQQAPEGVARSREVMTDLSPAERRMDAAEEDARARTQPGGEATHARPRAGTTQMGPYRPPHLTSRSQHGGPTSPPVPSTAAEKGPDARRRPKSAGEAWSLHVEPAGEGGRRSS